MGCGSSIISRAENEERLPEEASPSVSNVQTSSTPSQQNTGGYNGARSPLTQDQINSRIVSSPKANTTKVTDKLSIKYAYVSQRGYYPDGTL